MKFRCKDHNYISGLFSHFNKTTADRNWRVECCSSPGVELFFNINNFKKFICNVNSKEKYPSGFFLLIKITPSNILRKSQTQMIHYLKKILFLHC